VFRSMDASSARSSMDTPQPRAEPPLPPKALALQAFAQVERTSFEVSEAALVRDVVYCCQGIDGTHIKYSAAADAYVVSECGQGYPERAEWGRSEVRGAGFQRFGQT
jgi:hypothetical protein